MATSSTSSPRLLRRRRRRPRTSAATTTAAAMDLLLPSTAACALLLLLAPSPSSPPPLAAAALSSSSSSSTSYSSPSSEVARPPSAGGAGYPFPTVVAGGPIEDATCDVEQLEAANDSQLHVILAELMTTSFFRSFAVDLDQRCPLAGWNTKKGKKEKKDDEKKEGEGKPKEAGAAASAAFQAPTTQTTDDDDEEAEGCAGGLPDLDPGAEPACSVDLGGGSEALGFMGDASGATRQTEESHVEDPGEGEEEFECDGGKDELDDDAEPLCSLATDGGSSGNPFGGDGSSSSSGNNNNLAAALQSISERVGSNAHRWESESQQNTFAWTRVSDPVVENDDEPCDDEAGNLPETFWLDMCSQIGSGDGLSIVNLRLNPERNTGYNGTHIWNAIYEENCLALDGSSASDAMCYEERVLYRLLSGLHASTTLSIAKNYYPPSKRKGRATWEANPQYFIDKFADRPEHLRNLHFSYVVLLRALKKASPHLYRYEIQTGDILDDEMATILLRRLLDTAILRSCHGVFTAFDESLMFKEAETAASLRENFKGVFHNVSSILDCVQCQQCKLHGKMAMLGYGTALKILFVPEDQLGSSLERNEVVAFLNTIAKVSESVREVRELTHLYWSTHTRLVRSDDGGGEGTTTSGIDGGDGASASSSAGIDGADVLDAAVGAVSSLASRGLIDESTEAKLVERAFRREPKLMVLSKHYGSDLRKFLAFLPNVDEGVAASVGAEDSGDPDVIVVGTGLAGLAATLHVLDRGGRVALIEKEHRMGGNSNKASSGINACCPQNATYGDYLASFEEDTVRSAGSSARPRLIETLVGNSEAAVSWLKDRAGVDLSVLAQLGGHGYKRTHRPKSGMVGAEVIFAVQRAVKKYEGSGNLIVMMDARVTGLRRDENGAVVGVDVASIGKDGRNETRSLSAPNVVLATGGFASDRTPGSYLERYRPELMRMPATAGEFSTGDGISLGLSAGAGLADMEKVQVHPTGWVDPRDPSNPGKVLAGELMRGVGGILINRSGKRCVCLCLSCDDIVGQRLQPMERKELLGWAFAYYQGGGR
ncbi:hypothetical protein ACHAWF_013350 [Thalassiosira exigua]